ncbi:MAG: hypothetical protein HN478_21995 [Rhodospirillaceae bacterium]|jgi:aromatic ring-opening dioxygenase catalytic subunit (LigB family)|nr:hypothetical protein [Rhodospirillaceae bacterium]MBT4490668.1 hypothetical protein [Rhodospirillaceae bacterium]MBT5191505.1 hypothetical protein [Rhodospirillaceae bacterium]MBT5894739.1 hypothetical protein [Rhodospirillaceae bacterium]MBT6426810.1 hypothetical protein [Rhodospirillaceae bacterium]
MAKVAAAMAMTHSPGLTGWFDAAPQEEQVMALSAFETMRDHLDERDIDLLLIIGNDHLLNWPLSNTPEYTVGVDDVHNGPADWYDEWLALEKFQVQGHGALARFIVNQAARHGLALSHKRDMQFDDSVSVPVAHLNPDMVRPIIPITLNCTVPPIPEMRRAYEVGLILRQVIEEFDGDERVAVIGTGGLSHEPGGPRYFFIDEEFDLWFLDLLCDGDHEKLLAECTLERMEEAGSGGTAELLAWAFALAFTQGPAQVLGYAPSHSWRSGTGFVIWPEMRETT